MKPSNPSRAKNDPELLAKQREHARMIRRRNRIGGGVDPFFCARATGTQVIVNEDREVCYDQREVNSRPSIGGAYGRQKFTVPEGRTMKASTQRVLNDGLARAADRYQHVARF